MIRKGDIGNAFFATRVCPGLQQRFGIRLELVRLGVGVVIAKNFHRTLLKLSRIFRKESFSRCLLAKELAE
jgi:hypothetical protein